VANLTLLQWANVAGRMKIILEATKNGLRVSFERNKLPRYVGNDWPRLTTVRHANSGAYAVYVLKCMVVQARDFAQNRQRSRRKRGAVLRSTLPREL